MTDSKQSREGKESHTNAELEDDSSDEVNIASGATLLMVHSEIMDFTNLGTLTCPPAVVKETLEAPAAAQSESKKENSKEQMQQDDDTENHGKAKPKAKPGSPHIAELVTLDPSFKKADELNGSQNNLPEPVSENQISAGATPHFKKTKQKWRSEKKKLPKSIKNSRRIDSKVESSHSSFKEDEKAEKRNKEKTKVIESTKTPEDSGPKEQRSGFLKKLFSKRGKVSKKKGGDTTETASVTCYTIDVEEGSEQSERIIDSKKPKRKKKDAMESVAYYKNTKAAKPSKKKTSPSPRTPTKDKSMSLEMPKQKRRGSDYLT